VEEESFQGNAHNEEELEATRADKKTDNKEKIHEATTRMPQDEEKRMEEEREARTATQDAANNFKRANSDSWELSLDETWDALDELDRLYGKQLSEISERLHQARLLVAKNAVRKEAYDREVTSLDECQRQVKEYSASVDVHSRVSDEFGAFVDQYYERMKRYLPELEHLGQGVDEVDTGRTNEELEGCISGPFDGNPRAAKKQKMSFHAYYYR